MKKMILIALLVPMLAVVAHAQLRKIPAEVTEAFKKQYPTGSSASWSDKLTYFQVDFSMNGGTYLAKYDSKGGWKNSEQTIAAAQLPVPVKEGFDKSVYASKDWEVKEYTIMYYPGSVTKYRILVRKNAIDKKYLYFDGSGKMTDEATTL
jgi:hypothetical protein